MRQIKAFENNNFSNREEAFLSELCFAKNEEPIEVLALPDDNGRMVVVSLRFSDHYRVCLFNNEVCTAELWLSYKFPNGYKLEDYIIDGEKYETP